MREKYVTRSLWALTILCGIVFSRGIAPAADLFVGDSAGSLFGDAHYFAIMGEVSRPGVFEAPEPRLELLELVKRAGGATTTASGNVRIIREGKAGAQTFLAPGLKYELLPNDLVIVDAWQSRAGRPFGDNRSSGVPDRDSNGRPEKSSGSIVQLGLVNLKSRPVVLDVHPDEATLGIVLSLLQQSPQQMGEVTLIRSLVGVDSVSCAESVDLRLVSGTVVVFDPTTVDVKALPVLPPTVPAPQAMTVPPPLPIVVHEPLPQALTRIQAEAKVETARQSGAGQTHVQSPGNIAAAKKKSKPDKTQKQLASAERTTKEPQRATSHAGLLFLTLVGLSGLAVIAWKRWRAKLRAQPGVLEQPGLLKVVARDLDGAQALQALIINRLPVREEALRLPKEQEIFGRPRLDSPYRIDAAHVLSGPHFPMQPARPAVEIGDRVPAFREDPGAVRPQTTEASHVAPDAAGRAPVALQAQVVRPTNVDETSRKIRVDTAHPRSSVGALDRALATFEEGRS